MSVKAKYVELEGRGYRIEIGGTLVAEAKTLENAKGITDILNEKLNEAYSDGYSDGQLEFDPDDC